MFFDIDMYEDSSSESSGEKQVNNSAYNDISMLSNDIFGFNNVLTKKKAEKIIKKNNPDEVAVKFEVDEEEDPFSVL